MQNVSLAGLSLLVLEDEGILRKQVSSYMERLGADVTSVDSLQRARTLAAEMSFDFALLDVNLPDGLGTDLLKEKAFSPSTGVIVMTAQGGVEGAVEAMKLGAVDYLAKPFDLGELPLVITRARRGKQAERLREHKRKEESGEMFYFGSALEGLQAQLQKILAADARLGTQLPPVLIMGETGTGKTTIARWLHRQGPRSAEPWVEVNCSALPETLAESELFGHEKGAFTDARAGRIGLFEAASGGTLFLDELPSLSSALQSKVLKAIEDHKIRRVGSNKEIPIDTRIIAATNRDLKTLVTAGAFREDLYHRLDLFRISIPPLRDRGADILKLAERILIRLCERHRMALKPLSAAGLQRLNGYQWPGNVRELAHELERAIVFEEGSDLHLEQLSNVPITTKPASTETNTGWFNPAFVFPPEGFVLDAAIHHLIQHALNQTGNNVSAAARLLGVSRDYIRYRLAGQKSEPASTPRVEESPPLAH